MDDNSNQTQQAPVEPVVPVVDPNVPAAGTVDVPGSVPSPAGEVVPPVAPVEPVVNPTPGVQNPGVSQTPEQPAQNTDQSGSIGV